MRVPSRSRMREIDPNRPLTEEELRRLIHGDPKPPCERCGGTGWLDPIGPKADGSYITMRPCLRCNR
jgi:hypothetical protein